MSEKYPDSISSKHLGPKIIITPPGPKALELLVEESDFASPSFVKHLAKMVWSEGHGALVSDVDGNVYVDFTSGIAVTNVGHSHPKVTRAIQDQAGKLINCYDFPHSLRSRLLRNLCAITPGKFEKQALLLSGGGEAVGAALRLARVHKNAFEILSFHGGFYGRGLDTAAVTGERKYKRGVGPTMPGVLHAPYGYCYRCTFKQEYPSCDFYCVEYIDRVLESESTGSVAALIVEPIQGAGGYVVPPDGYLRRLASFCKERDIIMIVDEIQTGFGRTGKLFCSEYEKVEPDITTLGKGIANGVPMSAVVARKDIMQAWRPGEMSSTYGGNPLSCAASLATIEVLLEERLAENAMKVGMQILRRLEEMRSRHELIGDVRGRGLMIGVELVKDRTTKKPAGEEAEEIISRIFRRGVLMVPSGWSNHVLRVAPPLVISAELADKALEILDEEIRVVEREKPLRR